MTLATHSSATVYAVAEKISQMTTYSSIEPANSGDRRQISATHESKGDVADSNAPEETRLDIDTCNKDRGQRSSHTRIAMVERALWTVLEAFLPIMSEGDIAK